jgi:hypothetical protein
MSIKDKHIPNNSIPRYICKSNENNIHRKLFIQVFIAALFTIAKRWEKSKCASTKRKTKCARSQNGE